MDCKTFRNNIIPYIEGGLSIEMRNDMFLHMERCNECKELYKGKLEMIGDFDKVINNADLRFNSRRSSIMSNIDERRYKNSILRRLFYKVKGYQIGIACCMLLMIFIAVGSPYIRNRVNFTSVQRKQYSDNEKTSKADESTIILNRIDKAEFETKEVVPVVTGERKKELSGIMQQLKKKDPGVGPWEIVYADENKVLFYNYSHLLAYSSLPEVNGIYNAVDLEQLDVGTYQGSSIVEFKPSPNGQFCAIGNASYEADIKDIKKNIYLFDLSNNKSRIIATENMANLAYRWSDSSQYFATAARNGEYIKVYDVINNTVREVKLNNQEVKDIYVSDTGNIVIASDKAYLLTSNNENLFEVKTSGQILGIRQNLIVYYEKGKIYEYDMKNKKLIKDIGADFKLVSNDNKNFIFADIESMKVYNIDSNETYDYSKDYSNKDKSFSPDGSKLITSGRAWNEVIDYRGEKHEVTGFEFSFGRSKLVNGDKLVIVQYPFIEGGNNTTGLGSDKFTLGDFAVLKYDLKSDSKQVLFRP